MYLVVGLGNPGSEYKLNRHNAGFMVLDAIIKKYSLVPGKDKFSASVYKGTVLDQSVIAIKPQTFMNNSGKAVGAFINFFKIQIENVIVIYDEIDLALGKVKLKVGGGDAGHNGIKSINAHANKNYAKLRIGIDHPGHRDLVHSHVLGDFTADELKIINGVASKIAEKFPDIIRKEYDKFASSINQIGTENGI